MGAEEESTIVTDESVIDRMMLESYGMTVTDGLIQRINESTARSDNEKLFGIDSVFVLSGEGTEADIETYHIHPTWVFPNIGTMYRQLEDKK